MASDTAVYLYCVVRSDKRPSSARVPGGVPRATPAEAHRLAAGLWMVTAEVPLDVYGPSRLEPRLRDLDWVSQAAVAHEGVVEHFARKLPAIPAKLFTLFSTPDRAAADLGARTKQIQQALRHVTGAEEWGVRVFRRPDGGSTAQTARPASGADFLRARKQVRDAAAFARETAAAAAALAYDELRRHARDARVREARREPGTNPPILDAAFLVPARARARFKSAVKRQSSALTRAGAELVLTGPWPAYNFVAEDRP